jgi:hypothetical protein
LDALLPAGHGVRVQSTILSDELKRRVRQARLLVAAPAASPVQVPCPAPLAHAG